MPDVAATQTAAAALTIEPGSPWYRENFPRLVRLANRAMHADFQTTSVNDEKLTAALAADDRLAGLTLLTLSGRQLDLAAMQGCLGDLDPFYRAGRCRLI